MCALITLKFECLSNALIGLTSEPNYKYINDTNIKSTRNLSVSINMEQYRSRRCTYTQETTIATDPKWDAVPGQTINQSNFRP